MVRIIFENTKLVTVGSVAAVSGLLIGALWYRKYLRNKPPTKWLKVGEIEELCVYPVKSFKGIKTDFLECTPSGGRLGFMRDRSFVVIDGEGKFVTGRDYPKMTQVVPTISNTLIKFSCSGVPEEMELDIEKIEGDRKKVRIWDTWTDGIDCGDEIAGWISKCILGEESAGLRLLFCGLEDTGKVPNGRVTALSKLIEIQLEKTDGVSMKCSDITDRLIYGFFSDGVSYHLISLASIKELNSRLDGAEVSAMNFRPNLVIKGEKLIPFEEDDWKWVKVGDVVFQCLAPCTRCLLTTVDPNTGVKSKKMEPLASLRRYRYIRNPEKRKLLTSPAMGIYLGVRSLGNISVGDEVFIPEM